MTTNNGSVRKGTDEETNEMLYFKACPKCLTGTIEHSSDPWTEYLQCLNCGLMRDVPEDTHPVIALRDLHVQFKAQREAEAAEEAAIA